MMESEPIFTIYCNRKGNKTGILSGININRKENKYLPKLNFAFIADTGDGGSATLITWALLNETKLKRFQDDRDNDQRGNSSDEGIPLTDLDPLDLVIHGGDICYPKPTRESYKNNFSKVYKWVINLVDPTKRKLYYRLRFAEMVPWFSNNILGKVIIQHLMIELFRTAPGLDRIMSYHLPMKDIEKMTGPYMFVTAGNHDYLDGLMIYSNKILSKPRLGLFDLPQNLPYHCIRLSRKWFLFNIDDVGGFGFLDPKQKNFIIQFINLLKDRDIFNESWFILVMHHPFWLKSYESTRDNCDFQWLIKILGSRLRLLLAGDLHHYCRYQSNSLINSANQSPNYRLMAVTCGGGGAFAHSTADLPDDIVVERRKIKKDKQRPKINEDISDEKADEMKENRRERIELTKVKSYPDVNESKELAYTYFGRWTDQALFSSFWLIFILALYDHITIYLFIQGTMDPSIIFHILIPLIIQILLFLLIKTKMTNPWNNYFKQNCFTFLFVFFRGIISILVIYFINIDSYNNYYIVKGLMMIGLTLSLCLCNNKSGKALEDIGTLKMWYNCIVVLIVLIFMSISIGAHFYDGKGNLDEYIKYFYQNIKYCYILLLSISLILSIILDYDKWRSNFTIYPNEYGSKVFSPILRVTLMLTIIGNIIFPCSGDEIRGILVSPNINSVDSFILLLVNLYLFLWVYNTVILFKWLKIFKAIILITHLQVILIFFYWYLYASDNLIIPNQFVDTFVGHFIRQLPIITIIVIHLSNYFIFGRDNHYIFSYNNKVIPTRNPLGIIILWIISLMTLVGSLIIFLSMTYDIYNIVYHFVSSSSFVEHFVATTLFKRYLITGELFLLSFSLFISSVFNIVAFHSVEPRIIIDDEPVVNMFTSQKPVMVDVLGRYWMSLVASLMLPFGGIWIIIMDLVPNITQTDESVFSHLISSKERDILYNYVIPIATNVIIYHLFFKLYYGNLANGGLLAVFHRYSNSFCDILFSGMRIQDYKSFIRIELENETLTVKVFGIKNVEEFALDEYDIEDINRDSNSHIKYQRGDKKYRRIDFGKLAMRDGKKPLEFEIIDSFGLW